MQIPDGRRHGLSSLDLIKVTLELRKPYLWSRTSACQEEEFDADTIWAPSWFEQFRFDKGDFGVAETLSMVKNTSMSGMAKAGILESRTGKVRLLLPSELLEDWDLKKSSLFSNHA